MRRRATQRGFTFAELLIGGFLLAMGIGTLMFGMHHTSLHAGYLHDEQMAMHEAQGVLEQLSAAGVQALSGATLPVVLEPDSLPIVVNLVTARATQEVPSLSFLTNGRIAIQIRQVNPLDPDVFDIHVAVCWTYRGRAIGEAVEANSCVDGPDLEQWVNSPVMVTTRVARKG